MTRKLLGGVLVWLLLVVPCVALARPSSKQSTSSKYSLKTAERSTRSIPSRLELRPGERVTVEGVNAAAAKSSGVVRVDVSGGNLTVLALNHGQATINLFGGGSPTPGKNAGAPKKLSVTVRR